MSLLFEEVYVFEERDAECLMVTRLNREAD